MREVTTTISECGEEPNPRSELYSTVCPSCRRCFNCCEPSCPTCGDKEGTRLRAVQAAAENERLRAALEQVEWAIDDKYCPWCGQHYGWRGDDGVLRDGHAPNCPRQVALGLDREGQAAPASGGEGTSDAD